MDVMNILSWCVFGLVVGLIARFLLPGRQSMGLVLTMGLGVVGSFVGGAISHLIFEGSGTLVNPSGWAMSIVGALIVLLVYSRFAGRG